MGSSCRGACRLRPTASRAIAEGADVRSCNGYRVHGPFELHVWIRGVFACSGPPNRVVAGSFRPRPDPDAVALR